MARNKKISRTRWTESEKLRLLEFRDNHTDWSWEEIKELFPGRSTTALCKQYSDLKIKRDQDAEKMANNDDETTEEMTNNQKEVINTAQLSKEKKRSLNLGDSETTPRKQRKTGDVAANNDDESQYSPSEDSESEGGDIDPKGDIGRSPTARQLRSKPRKQQLDVMEVRSASTLKRPSKLTKLLFTAQREARDSFSTTAASPDPRTVKVKNPTKTTKTASASSHPTLSGSHSFEKATATNTSNISSEIVSPVQETRPSLSPAAAPHSAQKQQPTTNGHSSSKPEQQMAPPPPTPLPAATTAATLEAGAYGYPPMQNGALMLMQAAIAMRDFPRERARVAQLEEANENLLTELQKLKEKEAEWKLKIGELKISNRNLEGELKKQADQVKKLEAGLKQMSEKNNHGALNSANGAINTDCEHCLQHIGRLNALTEENERMKQKYKLVAEAFAAVNDQV